MYHTFIGIDISKSEFVVSIQDQKEIYTFPNHSKGFKEFYETVKAQDFQSLVILEATGGYEKNLLSFLTDHKIAVHRAHPSQVKNFIRSLRNFGKSDSIDAKALALYAKERHDRLELYQKPSPHLEEIESLCQRRMDLARIIVQEKNRLKSPGSQAIAQSCETVIVCLQEQITQIDRKLEELVNKHPELQERQKVLQEIPGIGPVIAKVLIAMMPELGRVTGQQAASLSGVAPHPCESGKKTGYRHVKGGRPQVRNMLFMAAMTARRSKSPLADFYEQLIARGKKKMVALTALMRKIITIANAKLKEKESARNQSFAP